MAIEIDYEDTRVQWMATYASKLGVALSLDSECGIGRPCMGISAGGCFPDYDWYDNDNYESQITWEVWTPDDAYHKHPCVAVLRHGDSAESVERCLDQLYAWLRWFEANDFVVRTLPNPDAHKLHMLEFMMGKHEMRRIMPRAEAAKLDEAA